MPPAPSLVKTQLAHGRVSRRWLWLPSVCLFKDPSDFSDFSHFHKSADGQGGNQKPPHHTKPVKKSSRAAGPAKFLLSLIGPVGLGAPAPGPAVPEMAAVSSCPLLAGDSSWKRAKSRAEGRGAGPAPSSFAQEHFTAPQEPRCCRTSGVPHRDTWCFTAGFNGAESLSVPFCPT